MVGRLRYSQACPIAWPPTTSTRRSSRARVARVPSLTRTGEEHDHTARDDLDGAEILVPPNAPEWAQDRAALRDELRTIQQQIEQLQDFIRRGVEKVKEKVKGLVHGPQPDRADTSAEPTKPAQEPQRGGDRDGDTWIPGEGFLGRR